MTIFSIEKIQRDQMYVNGFFDRFSMIYGQSFVKYVQQMKIIKHGFIHIHL